MSQQPLQESFFEHLFIIIMVERRFRSQSNLFIQTSPPRRIAQQRWSHEFLMKR